jgi:threonine synthase
VNPYLIEGKKTCGHELGEQMSTAMPDWIAIATGDGCSVAGVYKGLREMHLLGIIDRVPRMLAVQAAGAAPLVSAFRAGQETVTAIESPKTIADSINVGRPRNALKALRAVRESNGSFVEVDDQMILDFMPRVARLTGVFAEPTAVAAVAGIAAARTAGVIGKDETALAVLTGNGLKDTKSAMRAVSAPSPIEPNIDEVAAQVSAARGRGSGG